MSLIFEQVLIIRKLMVLLSVLMVRSKQCCDVFRGRHRKIGMNYYHTCCLLTEKSHRLQRDSRLKVELLYGRHVRGPLDVLKDSWVGEKEDSEGEQNVLEYVVKMRERLANLTECVSENLEKAQNKQKAYYDKKARSRSFAPGDRVLLLLPSSTRKLEAAWQGPYTVIEKVGPVDYKLSMPKRRGKTNVFHVNMLRAWKEDGEYTSVVS